MTGLTCLIASSLKASSSLLGVGCNKPYEIKKQLFLFISLLGPPCPWNFPSLIETDFFYEVADWVIYNYFHISVLSFLQPNNSLFKNHRVAKDLLPFSKPPISLSHEHFMSCLLCLLLLHFSIDEALWNYNPTIHKWHCPFRCEMC